MADQTGLRNSFLWNEFAQGLRHLQLLVQVASQLSQTASRVRVVTLIRMIWVFDFFGFKNEWRTGREYEIHFFEMNSPKGCVVFDSSCKLLRNLVDPLRGFELQPWSEWFRNSISLTSKKMADRTGLEPATSGVTGRHSNQLNYRSEFSSYKWWVVLESNQWPSPCKGDALPAELTTLRKRRAF